jgi:hypothetical protein
VGARKEEVFEFLNATGDAAVLHFPKTVVTPDERLEQNRQVIQGLFGDATDVVINLVWVPAGTSRQLKIHEDAKPGVYDYVVLVFTTRGPAEAEGNSRPKIIVDP